MKKPKPIFIIVCPPFDNEEDAQSMRESASLKTLDDDYHVLIVESATATEITFDLLNSSPWDHFMFWISSLFNKKKIEPVKNEHPLRHITITKSSSEYENKCQ